MLPSSSASALPPAAGTPLVWQPVLMAPGSGFTETTKSGLTVCAISTGAIAISGGAGEAVSVTSAHV